MGFWSSLKRIFGSGCEDDIELERLRTKHGINATAETKDTAPKSTDPGSPDFDPWEDIRNYRMDLFMGKWAMGKIRSSRDRDEKIKQEIEDIRKKRAEKEAAKAIKAAKAKVKDNGDRD